MVGQCVVRKEKESKDKINIWDRMVAKLKSKFLPIDYTLKLYKKLHNLRQNEMILQKYIEDFYRLSIRSRHGDEGEEVMARYINSLRYPIKYDKV